MGKIFIGKNEVASMFGSGQAFTEGKGIDITDNIISAKIDEESLNFNENNEIIYELPKATQTKLGGVTVDGETITVVDGKISAKISPQVLSETENKVYTAEGIELLTSDKVLNEYFYRFYEYVRCNSGSYIQTKINNITYLSFDITVKKSEDGNYKKNNSNNNILGCVSSEYPNDRIELKYDDTDNKYKIFYGTASEQSTTGYFEYQCQPTDEIHINFNRKRCIFENLTTGEKVKKTVEVKRDIWSDKELQIGGINNAESGGCFAGLIGNFKIISDGRVIYDCIPITNYGTATFLNWVDGKYIFSQGEAFHGCYREIDVPETQISRLTLMPFVGAENQKAGVIGAVPTPQVGDDYKYLKGNGEWAEFPIATNNEIGGVRPDGNTITITPDGTISAKGGSGGDIEAGLGIDVDKEGDVATISAKIGTNSELGIVKGDGITTFVDPDGTISSKTTLPDITAGDGINITHGTGHNLPEEYIELQYVRGKAGCYLDTGINADSKTAYQVVAQRLANPSDTFNVFGAVKTGAVVGVQFQHDNNARCFMGSYSADYTPTATSVFYDPITFYGSTQQRKITNNTTREVFQNENVYGTEFDVGKNYYIGKINGLTSGADFTGRLFEILIWQNDILVRDYIPAKKRETQEIGFYDLVSRTFNKSSTAAQFIEGPDAIPTTIISAKPVPKIRTNGYIYVDNINGDDVADEDRGLRRDKAFRTVQGALNIMSSMYKIGIRDCAVEVSNYSDNIIECLTIPYIESDGGNLLIKDVVIKTTSSLPALVAYSRTKIHFSEVTFIAEKSTVNIIQISGCDVYLSKCTIINNSAELVRAMISVADSNISIVNVAFQNEKGNVENWVNGTNSKVMYTTKSDVQNKCDNTYDGFHIKFCTFLYDGLSVSYPPSATEWIPYNVSATNMYLTRVTYDNFYYDSEHAGKKDKLSNIYDVNGLVVEV